MVEDCCGPPESVMENYDKLDSEDNLHITSFEMLTSILDIDTSFKDCLQRLVAV